MEAASRGGRTTQVIAAAAVAASLVLGLLVRLEEPLSNPVIPAEDPYTHMIRLKAHLAAGGFETLGPYGEQMYPPGMHALLAVVWTYAGGDLYPIFRFAPVLLGVVAVLGTGLLLWKHAGRVGAIVGAFGVALAPELVFRTTMMAPTALDVALLPVLFYALLEVLAGRLSWTPIAAGMVLFLVFTHPWLLAPLALAGLGFLLLAVLLPWPTSRSPRLSTRGLALSLAIVGGGLGLVLSTCAGLCGPGYQQVLPVGDELSLLAPVVLVVSLLPAAFLAIQPQALAVLPEPPFETRSRLSRVAIGVAIAITVAAVTLLAVRSGMPEFVDLPRMLGWPLLVLAALALVCLPFLASPLAYLAAGTVAVCYPLAVFPPLGSEFISHRIVVYLGLGVAILAGLFAEGVAGWLRSGLGTETGSIAGVQRGTVVGLVAMLAVAGSMGGAVLAQTPEPYEEGWYRLYEPCELEALREVADRIGRSPDTLVVAGDWRPSTVLAALADPQPRVWFSESFFVSGSERRGLGMELEASEGSLYVLEERHLHEEKPDLDLSFLRGEDWVPVASWCGAELGASHELRLHVMASTR